MGCCRARRRRDPRRAGGDRTHLTIMCLRSMLVPGATWLPKSHSQLHERADPTVIHFCWEALPSGMDAHGSAAHTGNGVPGCHSAKLQGWDPMGFGYASEEQSQGGLA